MDEDILKSRQKMDDYQQWGTEIMQTHQNSSIEAIKELMVNALEMSIYLLRHEGLEVIRIPEQKQYLVSMMTAVYLKYWLEDDPRARDNLRHYMREQEAMERGVSIDKVRYPKGYQYANKKSHEWDVMEGHIARQAQAENRSYYRDPQKKRHGGHKNKMGYVQLWKREMSAKGKLLILDLLLHRKNIFETSNKRDHKNLVLEGYRSYHELFKPLLPEKDAKSIHTPEQNRRYVVTAIALHEMEYTYRVHAIGTLARFWLQESKRWGVQYSTLWKSNDIAEPFYQFWARSARIETESMLRLLNAEGGERMMEYISYDVLSSASEIINSFYRIDGLDYWYQEIALEREMFLVACMMKLPHTMPSWEEKDFANARQFFETEYPIYQIYNQMMGGNQRMWLVGLEPAAPVECSTAIKRFYQNDEAYSLQHAYNPEAPMRKEGHRRLVDYRQNKPKRKFKRKSDRS